jgi:hypothetical protein
MSTRKCKTVIALVVEHDDDGANYIVVMVGNSLMPFDDLPTALDFINRQCDSICEEDRTKQQDESE